MNIIKYNEKVEPTVTLTYADNIRQILAKYLTFGPAYLTEDDFVLLKTCEYFFEIQNENRSTPPLRRVFAEWEEILIERILVMKKYQKSINKQKELSR